MPLTTVDQGLLSTNAQYTGFKNRIINGDMVIDQRNAGAAVTATGTFPVDRFRTFKDTASGTLTGQRSTIAPAGFTNSLSYTITSAFTPSSSEGNSFTQIIEGFNVADLAWGTASAQPVTLSFWVRASVTGTYGGSLRNNAANRSYPFSYTISAANTFEYKTITVPGETTGTWETSTSAGIYLFFSLGTGSVLTGTAGAWANGNFINVTGATNITSTAGATYYITGVQLERGQTATSFDVLPYGTELNLCKRYFQTINGIQATSAAGVVNSVLYAAFTYPVEMRATPTFSVPEQLSFDLVYDNTFTQSSAAVDINTLATGNKGAFINYPNFTGLTYNRTYCQSQNTRVTRLSAEL
jgi:hypothetical protein